MVHRNAMSLGAVYHDWGEWMAGMLRFIVGGVFMAATLAGVLIYVCRRPFLTGESVQISASTGSDTGEVE